MTEHKTVLVVDENQTRVESFKLLLEQEGYTVLTAAALNDALERLREYGIFICLVGLNFEKEKGLRISRELMSVNERLKIIILDDRPHYKIAVDVMKIGVFDYISWTQKPQVARRGQATKPNKHPMGAFYVPETVSRNYQACASYNKSPAGCG